MVTMEIMMVPVPSTVDPEVMAVMHINVLDSNAEDDNVTSEDELEDDEDDYESDHDINDKSDQFEGDL